MSDEAMIGTTLTGRYLVQGVLGEGGMGVVFDAWQEELDRSVAIKVMRAEYASDPAVVERFLREAKAVGALGHPNIVDVYDVGRTPDGRPFMVMPRLEGHDLAVFLEEGLAPIAPARIAELLAGPAAALDLMHASGIVHRDLKPENLFLVRLANGAEVVKLVDFGLAALLKQPQSRLTRTGLVTGTPQYMSPEATSGDLPDGLGDVYALAAIAFELLAGRPPFDDPDPIEVLVKKRQAPAPRLSELGVKVAPAVEAVIARGLEREPSARQPTAGALVAALREAAREAPTVAVVAPPSTTSGRTRPAEDEASHGASEASPPLPIRRASRAVVVAGALAIVAAVGALFSWLHDAGAAATVTAGATPTPERARETEVTPSLEVVPARETEVTPSLEAEPAALRPAPTGGTVTTGETEAPLVAAAAPPRSRRAAPARATASEVSAPSSAAPAEDPARAEALVAEGTRALLQGRVPAAITAFREATVAAPRHAPAWRGLGLANERLGRDAEALAAYRRYLRLAPGAADAANLAARVRALAGE